MDMITRLCDSNPGAVLAMTDLLLHEEGLICIAQLDHLEIRGPNLYVLHNDRADGEIERFVRIIKANIVGLILDDRIKELSGLGDKGRYVELAEFETHILGDTDSGNVIDVMFEDFKAKL